MEGYYRPRLNLYSHGFGSAEERRYRREERYGIPAFGPSAYDSYGPGVRDLYGEIYPPEYGPMGPAFG